MRSRQVVCNDPAIAAEIRQNFVPVAADDVSILQSGPEAPAAVRHVKKALLQLRSLNPDLVDGNGLPIPQGIGVMTPGGELLGHEASLAKPEVLRMLVNARKAYQALPSGERRGDQRFEAEAPPEVPSEVIQLDVVRRTLAPGGLSPDDYRHPLYFHLGRVWLLPDEVPSLLPESVELGAAVPLPEKIARRLFYRSNLTPEYVLWFGEKTAIMDGTKVQLVVEALKADGAVELSISGPIVLETPARRPGGLPVGRFEGRIAGRLTVGPDLRSLRSARFVTAGRLRHQQDDPSRPEVSDAGALFTLGELDRAHPVMPAEYESSYFH